MRSEVFRPGLLDGQVAIVSGGGSGIGRATALELARLGAQVVVCGRRGEALEETAALAAGDGVAARACDIRAEDEVAALVDFVLDRFGRIDLLVNNAAGNFYAPSATLSPNAWRAVVETDLYGSFYCAQAAYPVMKAQGGGRIVSISMTLHYRGWPLMAHATAAKAGVDALTRTLALEWAPDRITVNAVAPGPIPTEGVKQAFTPPDARAPDLFRMDEYATRAIPLGRWGTPADVGQMVAFLAGPAGEWITGAIFVVDGGSWLAGGRP
jgi:2,4-dienoyl-CoA reductase [(3E)-enoyl-CoA-producing], peroxisomal